MRDGFNDEVLFDDQCVGKTRESHNAHDPSDRNKRRWHWKVVAPNYFDDVQIVAAGVCESREDARKAVEAAHMHRQWMIVAIKTIDWGAVSLELAKEIHQTTEGPTIPHALINEFVDDARFNGLARAEMASYFIQRTVQWRAELGPNTPEALAALFTQLPDAAS